MNNDDDDFDAKLGKVGRVLAECGLTIRAGSLPALTRKIFETGEPLTASEISLAVRKALPEFGAAARRASPVPHETGIQRLERANLDAHNTAMVSRPKVEQRKQLTPAEKERYARWGAGSLLDRANEETIPPAFVTEANDDE
jgi:hypothetical protein